MSCYMEYAYLGTVLVGGTGLAIGTGASGAVPLAVLAGIATGTNLIAALLNVAVCVEKNDPGAGQRLRQRAAQISAEVKRLEHWCVEHGIPF